MNYYLIGTGRMARFLAARLNAGGHVCTGVWGRDGMKARALADEFGLPVVPELPRITDGPDAALLAVSDGAVAALAASLRFRETTLVHFSGTLPLGVLLPTPRRAILWPVYSIAAGTTAVPRTIPCAWDATAAEAEQVVASLSNAVSGSLYRTGDDARRQLHLAAVIGNNFTSHLMTVCAALCAANGLPFSLLQPLLRQTFERTGTAAPASLQTGPAVRGDAATMAAHLELLRDHPAWAAVYAAVSASIAATHRGE